MQQVSKSLIIFLLIFFVTGCSYKAGKPSIYEKTYDNNITKDQLLNTIKQYFKTKSDDYVIESYENSLYIFKPTIGVNFLEADIKQYNYEINVSINKDNSLNTKMVISKMVGYDTDVLYLDSNSSCYKNFWKEIDKKLK